MTTVRTRFAPSPTGDLHLGNLRIAIFNYLFARRHGGEFVIRVEDTDEERNVPGALEQILDDLRWAGLEWDEGPDIGGPYGPYRQSERGDGHRELAMELERRGAAYRCYCTDEELVVARVGRASELGCPGGCRLLSDGEATRLAGKGRASSLRFAVPAGVIHVKDEVRGTITFEGSDIGDFIILRHDGRATYNFAVVADDVAMRITHVIRGSGHLSNTPKQALVFDALGEPRPAFAHLPMVLGPDRRKLSKREGAAGMRELRDAGFHPDGVVNYLSLLGWSPGDDREVLDRTELISEMDLERVGASDAIFDPEKMKWISGQHIERMSLQDLADQVLAHLDDGEVRDQVGGEALEKAVGVIRDRLSTFGEARDHLKLVLAPPERLAEGRAELRQIEGAPGLLAAIAKELEAARAWEAGELARVVRDVGKEQGFRGAALFHPVRLALTGVRSGPELGGVMEAIGRDRVLALLRGV